MKNFDIFKKEKKILVVGDIMLDRYYEGRVDRISPEAPVPILKVSSEFDRPGGAANVAINISRLGLQVTLVGYVGDDPVADALAKGVEVAGVKFRGIRSLSCPTILKLRALSQKQQIIRIDFEESFAAEDHSCMVAELGQMIAEFDVIVLSDYAKGTLQNASEIIDLCLNHNKPVFVDPKGKDFLRYAGATMITPNLSEFTNVAGCYVDDEQFFGIAHKLRSDLNLTHILVTRGEDGMTLFSDSGVNCNIAADAREVYDVTGAGDTVIATLAAAYASGVPMEQAVRLSNIAAGLVVARTGTSSVTAEEVIARLQELTDHKIADPIEAIKAAKSAGHKIVMTNGCFDILHSGHVSYLDQARELGDKLVVGINTDASISRLKGQNRPINTLEDRMALLSALRCVDWVIPFDGSVDQDGALQDTPLTLIKNIVPDILVKGGDYSLDSIVGASDVIQSGGRVVIIPLVEGRSTTAIVNRIADASMLESIS